VAGRPRVARQNAPEPGSFEAMAADAISEELAAGRQAVAWAVEDAGDRRARCRTFRRIVETRARITRPQGEATEEIMPLFGIWDLVAEGTEIHDLGRPSAGFLFWEATAHQETADGRVLIARARDYRGMPAALLSPARRADGRAFGERTTELLLRSSIEGVRGRVAAAARRIGEDPRRPSMDLRTIAAGVLAEYDHEKATTDGGAAVALWCVIEVGPGSVNVLASSKPGGGRPRRDRLNDALLKALEEDASGHELHAPRSNNTFLAFPDDGALPPPGRRDTEAGRTEVRWDEARQRDFSAAAIDRVTLDDLVGGAGLTEREREVFELRHVDGLKLAEIAERLGVTVGAVKSWDFRARKKLDAAAGM